MKLEVQAHIHTGCGGPSKIHFPTVQTGYKSKNNPPRTACRLIDMVKNIISVSILGIDPDVGTSI